MTNIEIKEIINDRLCCIEELTNLIDLQLGSIQKISDKIMCMVSTIENIDRKS